MEIPTPEPSTGGRPDGDAGSVQDRLRVATQIVTLVVALSAIGLSVWQGAEMRQHNRLSVIPKLEVGGIWGSGTGTIGSNPVYTDSVVIENAGLGPAVLHRIQVRRADSVVYDTQRPGDVDSLYMYGAFQKALRGYQKRTGREAGLFNVRTYAPGTMLPTEGHPLFQIQVELPDSLDAENVYPVRQDLASFYRTHELHVCYCSVYREDCAVASLWGTPPDDLVCRAFLDAP
jgi:hypothetical protein